MLAVVLTSFALFATLAVMVAGLRSSRFVLLARTERAVDQDVAERARRAGL